MEDFKTTGDTQFLMNVCVHSAAARPLDIYWTHGCDRGPFSSSLTLGDCKVGILREHSEVISIHFSSYFDIESSSHQLTARKWEDRICQEFVAQAAKETELGLTPEPFMQFKMEVG